MSDTSSRLRIVWIYPDLLSTYGDQGNVLILRRRAELRGIATETVHVYSSDPVPVEGDVYLLGGGEDRPQILAAERLRADGGLKRAAAPRSAARLRPPSARSRSAARICGRSSPPPSR